MFRIRCHEDEYYACSSAVENLEYVRLLLRELRIFSDDAPPPKELVNSEPAMAISQGPTHRSRTKNMNSPRLCFVITFTVSGLSCTHVEHCPSAEQTQQSAEMWTKQLGPGLFVGFRHRFMGLIPFLRS